MICAVLTQKYAVLFVILNFIVDVLSCTVPKIPKKGNAGLKWNRQQVDKMKNIAKKAAESVITLAKKNVKADINSTGSPWSYQPRMPKSAEIYKNK